MKKTFNFYTDPGHGWIKVSRKVIEELNLLPVITHCSYVRNDFFYLEEDLDADNFIQAFEKKYGIRPKFITHVSNKSSKIRSYSSYKYEK